MRLVEALDRDRRVTAVPFQRSGVPAAHGLTVAECEAAAWAVTPGPEPGRYRGAAAVNAVLAVALGTAWPPRIYSLPGVRALQDIVYGAVARCRGWLPGVTPFCREHPARCR